jgi:hypothetical protein
MTSPLTAMRPHFPLVTLLVGLACAQSACNLGSLDYLQNGAAKRDGGLGDGQGTPDQDSTGPGDARLGTKSVVRRCSASLHRRAGLHSSFRRRLRRV